jgi:glycosyltransferase involved in cell wall biosynthesis|tara:strand:+ start:325176 stop:326360 length:1185 start_codon:yes stop_codon:yes gene_type:complete
LNTSLKAPQDSYQGKKTKLIFLITEDWFFCSHFIDRAKAALEAGYDVSVITNVTNLGNQIAETGIRIIPLNMDRRSINPLSTAKTLIKLIRIYAKERPDIVHHVALKPILLGGVAAILTKLKSVVNAVVGGGYTFTSNKLSARLLRYPVTVGLRLTMNRKTCCTIFENPDDLAFFVESGIVKQQNTRLIRGSGVDLLKHRMASFSTEVPTVVMAARLLWDKGLGELVEAAEILKAQKNLNVRFIVYGNHDPDNRSAVSKGVLESWKKDGFVEFPGFCDDITEALAESTIACLPSYREGLPKFLLEAMATGLPCVTTDVPGCREAVTHQTNGLLVPSKDPQALANALEILLENPKLCKSMGQAGRLRVEREFSNEKVIEETFTVYDELNSRSYVS